MPIAEDGEYACSLLIVAVKGPREGNSQPYLLPEAFKQDSLPEG